MVEPETQELHVDQVRRERDERARASEAHDPTEARQHDRRADRAAYLKHKLEERAESEERVEGEHEPGSRGAG